MSDREINDCLFSTNLKNAERILPLYHTRSAKSLELHEKWFRDAVAATPELAIGPCRQANLTEEVWYTWGVEIPVGSEDGIVGKIDVLLVSESGRIGIVETKLSYNPEARRSVIAQLLDYAVHLPTVELADLPQLPTDANGKTSLVDHEEVRDHLMRADFLLIVVGDELDGRAMRLGERLLGRNLTSEWDLAFVDLALYQENGSAEKGDSLIVPLLRRAWRSEPRQTVRVIVQGEAPEHRVVIERIEQPPPPDGRLVWDEQRFFDSLKDARMAPSVKEFARALADLPKRFLSTGVNWGRGRVGSLTLKRNGAGLVEFFGDGVVRFRPAKFATALGPGQAEAYHAELRALFPHEMRNVNYPYLRVETVAAKAQELLTVISKHLEREEEDTK